MPAVPDYFSKGLCGTYGADIPQQYAEDLRNVRIRNGVTVPRAGFRSVATQSGGAIRAMAANNGNLYAVQDGHLRKADLTAGNFVDIGSVATSGPTSMEVFGNYTVIFLDGTPYVYDGTTLAAVSTFIAGSNLRFGKAFLNFMWAAGGNTGASSKRSVLYVSRPVSLTNPQYCYDWTGSGSDAIPMKADIVGLASSLDRLFIFQEGRIDWIGKQSYTTIGGVTTFTPDPLSKGDTLAGKDAAVVAGDKIIFLTSKLRIKTIGYALGVDQPEVGGLSEPEDDPKIGIQKWIDENLHADQSAAYAWYDDAYKLVKFHVRSRTAPYNDTVLIWDMVNKTFLVDDNKFFGSHAKFNLSYYCGSCIDGELYQDEYGEDDDGLDIAGYRNGCKLSLGLPGVYKMWSGVKLNGTERSGTSLDSTSVADGKAVDFCTISNDSPTLTGASVASFPVGQNPVSGPVSLPNVKPFLKDRGPGYINVLAKRFGLNVSFRGSGLFFSLDSIETREKATKYVEISEMTSGSVNSAPAAVKTLVTNSYQTVLDGNGESITLI